MVSSDPVSKWEEFIRSRYWDDLLELADSYPESRSLLLEFSDLDRYDPEFADELLDNPDAMLEAAHAALREIDLPMDVVLEAAHVRITNLPGHLKTRDLRSDHIGKLIAIEGQVRTATEVRPKILAAAYECQRCGHTFYVNQSGTKYQEPYECPNDACDRRGPFKLLLARSRFIDAQKVRIQESPEDLRGGEQPQTLDVELEDDIAGEIFPGDRVVINGMLRSFQRTTQTGKSTYFDLFLDGISIEMTEQEFEEIEILPEDEEVILELSRSPEIYEKIIRSIAPSIYGYEDVKEALSLQLVSGFPKKLPDGARIRGDIHILLVGDPGIAKSQLLRYMAKISPRGIYTSGKSSTSAGLTATAIKDELGDGRWTIEAGALVLADKGIAAVDEMDKMTSEDRSALHEAMEQQSYHPLTEVQISDGRKVRIGQLVDEMMEARLDGVVRGVDCEILPLNGEVSIPSTDLASIFQAPINRLSRHVAPDHFIRIRYSNGREVLVTPEHPVYILRGGVACVPACNVLEGDYVPAPRSIPCGDKNPELLLAQRPHSGEKIINLPDTLSPALCRILGYLATEGHFHEGSRREIGFTSKDDKLLHDMDRLVREVFGIRPSRDERNDGVVALRLISAHLYSWFEANFGGLVHASRERRIPPIIFRCTKEGIREFLSAAFLSEGGARSTPVAYSTASHGMAEDFQDLLLCLGISSRIAADRNADTLGIYIMEDSIKKFQEIFWGFGYEKLERTGKITLVGCRSALENNVLWPAGFCQAEVETAPGPACEGRFGQHFDCEYGLTADVLARHSEDQICRPEAASSAFGENFPVPEAGSTGGRWQSCRTPVASATRINVGCYEKGGHSDCGISRMEGCLSRVSPALGGWGEEIFEAKKSKHGADISHIQVVEVTAVPNDGRHFTRYVYDMTVEPTHSFISQGLVLHNTISVAKAGVMATLKSRCALLAAANPKMGRFDKYEPVAPQINLTPALMSRFDLIFVLTDDPDTARDTHIAGHIIRSNYAGELSTQRSINSSITQEEIENAMTVIKPEIEPEMLRKYVAYARKNVFPTLTDEAKERFQNYYVDLRGHGQDSNKPVPVTARQLEALIRLGEASARLRLNSEVTIDDANRVIHILESCLKKVGVDPETGQLDADIIAVGISKSTRDNIKLLTDIIREVSAERQGPAPLDLVLERAVEKGIDEHKAEENIIRMWREGTLIQPRDGFFKVP